MKKQLYIAFAMAFAVLSSCSDFLDEQSQDEVIVKTATDYSELLLGSGYPSPTGSLYNVLYLLDDDYMLNENSYSSEGDYQTAIGAFPYITWQSDMWEDQTADHTTYENPYTQTYERIMGVNAVLDGIDEATGSTEEREQVKAEALGLRGYYYYMLVNIFGEPYSYNKEALGVPLKLTADMETNGRPCATVAEVYQQILSDLQSSASLFAKYEKSRGSFRINLPAVDILLCRAYLQMENWDGVIQAATEAINNAEGLTNYLNEGTSRKSFSSYDYTEVEWLFGNGYRPCSLTGMKASDDLLSCFAGNDTRKKLWFYNGNVFKHRLLSPRTPTQAIRISEAYLSRAEAYARKGLTEQALADLNTLRENRYTDYVATETTDAATLLNEILAERRLELCFDEVRWFDLRRLGMPQISHVYKAQKSAAWQTYTLKENDAMYTLPIPNEAITENGNLRQNASADEPERTPSL